MKPGFAPVVLALLLVLSTIPYPASADPPMADAGMDQVVTKGTTVQLDATGSQDPDGAIQSYRWTIRDPDGNRVPPDCPSCGRTTFVANTVGTYEVSITVTGSDGETATDTLYVEVEPGESPSVVLTGPSDLQTGQTGTYVAEAEDGDAPLERVVWLVDGDVVEVDDVRGETGTAELQQQFASTSTHHVTARVVDTDDQRATSTIDTTVFTPAVVVDDNNGIPETDPRARGTAVVNGPNVVTGEQPLRATYSIAGTHIDSVTWWKDGARIGSGNSITTSFDPGIHTLHAKVTYNDQSTGIGRFSDDTTRVEADPKPELDLSKVSGIGGLTAQAIATDDFGNLQSLELRLDGEVVLSRTKNHLEIRKASTPPDLEIGTIKRSMEPGVYDLELVAADSRGQQTTIQRDLEIKGPPEVIRSEFVHEGDLDVYHPRIEPERYTAKHVIEIDLNGVDLQKLNIQRFPDNILLKINGCGTERTLRDDVLVLESCWASEDLKPGMIETKLSWMDSGGWAADREHWLNTTSSDPEIHLRVVSGGAIRYAKEWGLVVDASRSFDPDGTELSFEWSGGANSSEYRDSLGKLDSMNVAGLVVRDSNGGETVFDGSFLAYMNPKIEDIKQISSGPYLPDESIQFRITSYPYELPKNRYRKYIHIESAVSAGEVVESGLYEGEFAGSTNDQHEYVDTASPKITQHAWVVEVPASAFLNGNPTFETYNAGSREDTFEEVRLPDPYVLEPGLRSVESIDITTRYDVREIIYDTESTVSKDSRQNLETRGYSVYRTTDGGIEWLLERKEQIAKAVYATESTQFQNRGSRSVFLDMHPDWYADGSKIVEYQVTEEVQEWRDSIKDASTFTGNKRQKEVQAAEYRVEKKYRYEYTKSVTRTRTKTKTYQYTTTEEYTETVEECNRYIGCYDRTVTRTRTVTKTGTRDITETYTTYVTKSATYWSVGKRSYSHSYTGDSRRTLVQAAKFKTQYEHQFSITRTEQTRKYIAAQTYLVSPAEYEWREYRSTPSEVTARALQLDSNVRIGGSRPLTKWTLRKQTGSEIQQYDTYSNKSEIVRTHANVTGTIVSPYTDPENGEVIRIVENQSIKNYTTSGFVDIDLIKEKYISDTLGGQDK